MDMAACLMLMWAADRECWSAKLSNILLKYIFVKINLWIKCKYYVKLFIIEDSFVLLETLLCLWWWKLSIDICKIKTKRKQFKFFN